MNIFAMSSKMFGVDESQQNILRIALILYVLFQIVTCSSRDDCQNVDGFNMYWDEQEQECKKCLPCNAGFELNKVCGDGEGKGAECVECKVGFYSDSYGYDFCRPCQTCPNAKVARECTSHRNRECGECDPGYYKHLYGTCEKCSNEEECTEYSVVTNANEPTIPVPRRVPVLLDDQGASENNNSTEGGEGLLYAAIVLPIIATVLIVILLVIVVYMKRRSAQLNRQRRDEENGGRDGSNDNSHREEVEETTIARLSHNNSNEGYTGTPNMERAAVHSGSRTEESVTHQSHNVNESQETVPLLAMNGDAPVQTTDVQSDKSELVIGKNATTEHPLSQDSQKDIGNGRGNESNPPEPGNVVVPRDEVPNPESMHDVKKCDPQEDKKLKERRERAIALAKDKSISKDLSYEVMEDICTYFKADRKSYRILASRVGMTNEKVKALSEPNEVLQYMQTSMEGKRDIARLITELIDLPRYDIVDDVVCLWVFKKYDSETEDQKI